MRLWGALRALLWIDPLICLSTIFMGSLSFLASLWDGTGQRQHRIARRWARMVLAVSGVTVTVKGLEKLCPGMVYVFCPNHLSLIDTPLVFGHLPWEFRILAKKGLFRIPFLGWHLRRAGHLPVVEDDVRASVRNLADAARRVQEGVSILIFPEGARSPDGTMGPLKAGAAFVAIKAGVPIVPMGILGTGKVHVLGSLLVHPGAVELHIGAPLPTSGLSSRDVDRLLGQLGEQITALLDSDSPGPLSISTLVSSADKNR